MFYLCSYSWVNAVQWDVVFILTSTKLERSHAALLYISLHTLIYKIKKKISTVQRHLPPSPHHERSNPCRKEVTWTRVIRENTKYSLFRDFTRRWLEVNQRCVKYASFIGGYVIKIVSYCSKWNLPSAHTQNLVFCSKSCGMQEPARCGGVVVGGGRLSCDARDTAELFG